MAHANLNITISEKPMLKKSKAAAYTDLPRKHFESVGPVRTLELQPGLKFVEKTVWTFGVKAWLEADAKRNIPSQTVKIIRYLRTEMSKCSQSQSNERSA